MPVNRAPSYYHWAQDNPCTTNRTYGYFLEEEGYSRRVAPPGSKKPQGPNDYTRPFSNSAFFPQISYSGKLTTAAAKGKSQSAVAKSSSCCPPCSINRFDINRGYVMGDHPVYDRVLRRSVPVGVKLERSLTAPPAYQRPVPKAKDLYLWHTLAGSLVHCKNNVPTGQIQQGVY